MSSLTSVGWSPGVRDTAVGGLVSLFLRPVWQDADVGPSLANLVSRALGDPEPLVRFRAAHAASALHRGLSPEDRVRTIHGLLDAEPDPTVRTELFSQLTRDAGNAPLAVDAVVQSLLGSVDELGAETGINKEHLVSILAFLSISQRTPYSSELVEFLFGQAPSHAGLVTSIIRHSRDYLRPSAPTLVEGFRLFSLAAQASLRRLEQQAADTSPVTVPTPASVEDQVRGAVEVIHAVAQEIYFASGAYSERQNNEARHDPELAAFADLAFPILMDCASSEIAQCIDYAAQTMVFLGSLDEARALLALAEIVPMRGAYTYDTLAGHRMVPYLRRMVAENRALVLHDPRGVAAFRHLLAAFAAAGNPDALELAYNFSNVFR